MVRVVISDDEHLVATALHHAVESCGWKVVRCRWPAAVSFSWMSDGQSFRHQPAHVQLNVV
jgi:hypothetical protein